MRVRFSIPGPLTSLAGGQSRVEVETSGSTLQDALESLFAAHPGLRDRVLTERREIRPHVNVFVGQNEARAVGGLAAPLAEGAEIAIIPAISGGSPPRRHHACAARTKQNMEPRMKHGLNRDNTR